MTGEGLIGQGVGIHLITWERAINGSFPRPLDVAAVDDSVLCR
jgi:hypothetical protein